MKDLIIVGASGFGRELLQMVKEINASEPEWNVLGFLDDNLAALDGVECSYGIIGTVQNWQPKEYEHFAIAIAAPKVKKRIVAELEEKGAVFASLLHPTAKLADHVSVGRGLIMAADNSLSVNVRIGDFVFMNHYAGIGHDCVVGSYCMIGPRSSLSGHTTLGEGVTIGAHACTHPGVTIGEYATLGMNSVARKKVKPYTTVFGVPAMKIC